MRTQKNSASFIRHEPCDNCGSKDNRGVWDDGSKWCFGCQTYTPPNSYNPPVEETLTEERLTYPRRLQKELLDRNKKWLRSFGFTDQELQYFMMDPLTQRHVILCFEDSELVYYEARSVTGEKPKTLSKGTKPIKIFNQSGAAANTLCLTEDVVSAILCSRQVPTGCLFGSALSDHQLTYLEKYDNIIIWLDYDKTDVALKWVDMLTLRGYNVAVVVEDRGDPKDLTEADRSNCLMEARLDLALNRKEVLTNT